MSLNHSHYSGVGNVVLFYGERLIIFYDGCEFKLGDPLRGNYRGRVYLTSHRVIFTNVRATDSMLSFSMPFIYMKGVDIKQPVFGANRVVGTVMAEPGGGWQGEATFSITFNKGGAIEFGQALVELGKRACAAKRQFQAPPPYSLPTDANGASQYYACPPPAYAPVYNDTYYNFVHPHEAFSVPPQQSMYYMGAPPPYPGATPAPGAAWGAMPQQPVSPYPQQQQQAPFNGPANGTMNFNSSLDQPMTAAHAAKAAEAAASASNSTAPGYYFPEDPHTVYAQPSAPPPHYAPPSYQSVSEENADTKQPPSYGTTPQEKKDQ